MSEQTAVINEAMSIIADEINVASEFDLAFYDEAYFFFLPSSDYNDEVVDELEKQAIAIIETECVCEQNIFCQKCFDEHQESQAFVDTGTDAHDWALAQEARSTF